MYFSTMCTKIHWVGVFSPINFSTSVLKSSKDDPYFRFLVRVSYCFSSGNSHRSEMEKVTPPLMFHVSLCLHLMLPQLLSSGCGRRRQAGPGPVLPTALIVHYQGFTRMSANFNSTASYSFCSYPIIPIQCNRIQYNTIQYNTIQ